MWPKPEGVALCGGGAGAGELSRCAAAGLSGELSGCARACPRRKASRCAASVAEPGVVALCAGMASLEGVARWSLSPELPPSR